MAVKKRTPSHSKFVLNISLDMANVLVGYALSRTPSSNDLANFRNLVNLLDLESYKYNYDIYNRLYLIKIILDLRTNEGIGHPIILKDRVVSTDPMLADLCSEIDWRNDIIVGQDATAIKKFIDKKIQFYYFHTEMPEIIKLWEKCTKDGFDFSDEDFDEVNNRVARLVMQMENSTLATGILRRFNFSDPHVEDVLTHVIENAQSPSSILQTGIRQLNANLGPGFRGKKLYTILGLTGKFKSGTLLNIADQISKFNPQLEEVVDGKRNTILFITAENTIDETIERLYAMYGDVNTPFTEASPDIIKQAILENGRFRINPDMPGIDIEIRYFNKLAMKTSEIYNIVNEMRGNNQNVIAIIVDYVKVIDSVAPWNGDETARCTNVIRELKDVAINLNLPVITAQQINRVGNSVVDAAMRDGKQDLLRFVGNSDIGNAWAVAEESDVVMIVMPERHLKDGKLYLTFKFTKNRGGGNKNSIASDYFNHPFADVAEFKLMTDLDKEACVSVMSLASDLESVNVSELEQITQDRPMVVKQVGTSSILAQLGLQSA